MRTNKIRLTESQLNKVIKESVKEVLREQNEVLSELSKDLNYFYTEAMHNLENLMSTYKELPEEYTNMAAFNISMIREAINTLKLVHSGKPWEEKGPSLSASANAANGTLKYMIGDDFHN